MKTHLIVMTFDNKDEAHKVRDALLLMHKKPILGLGETVVVSKDQAGAITLHQSRDLTANMRVADVSLLSLIAAQIFGQEVARTGVSHGPGRTLAELSKLGVDRRFIAAVQRSMGANTSAMMLLVPKDGLADVAELLQTLTQFKGQIHRMVLPSQAEDYLRQMTARK